MPGDPAALLGPSQISNLNIPGKKEPKALKDDGVLTGGGQGTVIMTRAEVLLNLAELTVQNFNTAGITKFTSAKAMFNNAIKSSFMYLYGADEFVGTVKKDYNTYIQQGLRTVTWGASPNKLNAIMSQKWIATMALTAAQSWFGYSRTGYPKTRNVSE